MHLPVAVRGHPRAGDDPDRQELHGLNRPGATLAARNLSRSTTLASDLEVAGSLWAKFLGLMGRSSLEAETGLWLPDSNGIHMMFMRFPIDAVFLGRPLTAAGSGGAAGSGAAGSGAAAAAGSGAAGSGGAGSDAAGGGGEVRAVVSVHPGLRTWIGLVPFVRGAHGVLELPVGTIATTGTEPGDLIALD